MKKRFTLIEILFTIMILIILLSISWVAGNKVLRHQLKAKANAEMVMLKSAIERYNVRWGAYPFDGDQVINFAEQLSDYPIDTDRNTAAYAPKREMYIHYNSRGFTTSNDTYDNAEIEDCPATIVFDPYDEPYRVRLVNGDVEVYTPTVFP